jgi:hypothetical protein
MKSKKSKLICLALAFGAALVLLGEELRIFQPHLDASGRFWIYRNGTNDPVMLFAPHGWMSDGPITNAIDLNLDCREKPHVVLPGAAVGVHQRCMRFIARWDSATWAGIAFICGPDRWWGDTSQGWYFDLRALPHKKLVFFARGERGGERIRAQMGILAKKPFGDSLTQPGTTDLLELSTNWTRYEIDLSAKSANELSRVCNGFGVVVERFIQPTSHPETQLYVDDVFFE